MYNNILWAHKIFVWLFLLIYFIKAILLLANKKEALQKFTKTFKVPDMAVSTLFLLTGIYLWTQSGNAGTWLYVKVALVLASIPIAIIGFKKSNKLMVILSMLMLLVVYRFSETKSLSFKKQKMENVSSPNTVETDGKAIYQSKCSKCHGDEGTLGMSRATDLSKSSMDISARTEIITNGKNAMMPFKEQLNIQQIEAVAKYLDALKK